MTSVHEMHPTFLRFDKCLTFISTVVLVFGVLWSHQLSASVLNPSSTCKTIEFYSKEGCPHCAAASEFFNALIQQNPELDIQKIDIHESKDSLKRFIEATKRFDIKHPGVPLIVMCARFYVGFDSAQTSGVEIQRLLALPVGEGTVEKGNENLNEKDDSSDSGNLAEGHVELPVFGSVSLSDFGLPLFTIVIGLVDGFNPCAMWVLLFILSLVVNIKDRKKVVLIAGAFVVISGVVYFAFMAAWLNLFKVIGWSRLFQIALAFVAITVALIHIKDFFAFKQGVSLSIPDRFKPAIYKQSRRVVQHHNLLLSMVAVAILAIMVNFIELLCTAGLPALYTQILVQQDLSESTYYAYLALYNLAYVFDDALMVALAVVTLRHHKLQVQQGRWLKLLSGVTILVLGLFLLFAPSRLI